jgi:hypothetical protein
MSPQPAARRSKPFLLRQGDRIDTLIVHELGTHGVPSLDPRWQAESDSVVLAADRLARYYDGEATLVATAVGRSQWMRTPPPTVRELRVTLRTLDAAGSTPH